MPQRDQRQRKKIINKETDTTAIMLYSLKKETGHERPKDKNTNKKNYEIILTPCLPIHTLIWINHAPPIPSPIFANNITMDREFLVQTRQSNKCGSARNDEILNLHLGSCAGPWISIPFLLQDISHIYRFHRSKQLTKKKSKEPRNQIQLPTNRIVLPWSTYTEPRAERGRLRT